MSEPSHRAWIKLALVAGGLVLLASLLLPGLFTPSDRNQRFAQMANYLNSLCYIVAEAARVEPGLLEGSVEDFLNETQQRNWDDGIIQEKQQSYASSMLRLSIEGRQLLMLTVFERRYFARSQFATAQIDITDPNRISVKIFGPELYHEGMIE